MKEILKTPFYTFHVDRVKNRIYLKGRGQWVKKSELAMIGPHTEMATKEVSRGFRVLSDLRDVEVILVPDAAKDVMDALAKAGVRKAAVVWSGRMIARKQLEHQAETLGDEYLTRRKQFQTLEEAEQWLDM